VLDRGFQELVAEANNFKRSAFAVSTRATYRSHLRSYLRFCLYFKRTPVPADNVTLKAYVAFLARSINPNGINGYLNIVRILHCEAGLPNPLFENWDLKLVKRGVARELGVPPRQKLPITTDILLKLYGTLDLESSFDLAFWAACLLGFYGLLRKSTLLPKSVRSVPADGLVRGDIINMQSDSFVLVVRHSKTIQFGQRVLQIPYVSCLKRPLCPVTALLCHLTRSRADKAAPMFVYAVGSSLKSIDHACFVDRLRRGLVRIGLDASAFSGHSLRRGGCTHCFAADLSIVDIKLRGDWRSMAFERYVHVPSSKVFAAARVISEFAALDEDV
jgi:hypothetical protein